MEETSFVKRTFELVRKDFGLAEIDQDKSFPSDFEWLLLQLTRHIDYLLDHDFNRLMNALYRIDLSESKVQQILSQSEPGEIGKNIAHAIIEREKQKVITRQKYQS